MEECGETDSFTHSLWERERVRTPWNTWAFAQKLNLDFNENGKIYTTIRKWLHVFQLKTSWGKCGQTPNCIYFFGENFKGHEIDCGFTGLPGLLEESTTHWKTEVIEIYCPPDVKVETLRFEVVCFWAMRDKFCSRPLSSALRGPFISLVSFYHLFSRKISVSIFLSYMETTTLDHSLLKFDYLCKDCR